MPKTNINKNKVQKGGVVIPNQTQQQTDFSSLTEDDIKMLIQNGFTPKQIAEAAMQQGQPVPPIVQQLIDSGAGDEGDEGGEGGEGGPGGFGGPGGPEQKPMPTKTKNFPSEMDLGEYAAYVKVKKQENAEKQSIQSRKPIMFGYMFSDLISEDLLRDIKKTQGSFLVGTNLNNLFKEFKNMIINEEKTKNNNKELPPEEIFKRIGEFVDVDIDKIKEYKLGYRNDTDIPKLPELALSNTSTFDQLLRESKKYSDLAFKGKITPYGLLQMTRMLYKYKKTNAQWTRAATILELIYKYLSNGQSRETFFKNKQEIPLKALMDLEEFYNTDQIFMSEGELNDFKKQLNYYKEDFLKTIKKEINKNII